MRGKQEVRFQSTGDVIGAKNSKDIKVTVHICPWRVRNFPHTPHLGWANASKRLHVGPKGRWEILACFAETESPAAASETPAFCCLGALWLVGTQSLFLIELCVSLHINAAGPHMLLLIKRQENSFQPLRPYFSSVKSSAAVCRREEGGAESTTSSLQAF